MEKKFSLSWKASKQPRKQRKYVANAPIHLKRKMLSSNLSKELRKKFGKRSISLRKGDVVRILRGKFRGKTGKITKIETKNFKVYVEGIQIKKRDGSKVNVKLNSSNLQIITINDEDKKRNMALQKEKKTEEKKFEKIIKKQKIQEKKNAS
ncbi:50S ribosomal protein L24 [Candidatus Pacearchaeota archaeon]|nr:50S ribosomal protein L24 [Candidatus Pacearchaeota archaeon]